MKEMEKLGVLKGALSAEQQLALISVCTDLKAAVEGATFIQVSKDLPTPSKRWVKAVLCSRWALASSTSWPHKDIVMLVKVLCSLVSWHGRSCLFAEFLTLESLQVYSELVGERLAAKLRGNCWPPCIIMTVPIKKMNVRWKLAGDFWGTAYHLGNATCSSAGQKMCFSLSRYLVKAGSMTYGVTILTVRECCSQAQLSQSAKVLKTGLIHRFEICAAK